MFQFRVAKKRCSFESEGGSLLWREARGSTTSDGLERWDAAMGECFEVADVLDYKQDNAGTEHFLVRWKGYGARGRAAARLSLVISRDYPSEWQCFGIHVQTDFVDL